MFAALLLTTASCGQNQCPPAAENQDQNALNDVQVAEATITAVTSKDEYANIPPPDTLAARGETAARRRAVDFTRDRGGEAMSILCNTRSFDNEEPA